MMVWVAMVALSTPVSKPEALKIAEREMARLGFNAPRAYGAWRQGAHWHISLKDRRGAQLIGVVDPMFGRLLAGSNRSRWPKDPSPVTGPSNPPQKAKTLAKMQGVVGTPLRLHKWGESWARRIESRYDAFVSSRLLIGNGGVIRASLLQDPDTGEAIAFANVPFLPAMVRVPDRIRPSEAERVALVAMKRKVSTTATLLPPLPARPALYIPNSWSAVPVWRVRIDSEIVTSMRIRRSQQDVLVNSQSGRVEAIVPRNDW